eukprot:comp20752_c0_seq1/m.27194 comp20752_c0_seq1/g.27194  ORF comp20752_c0_seq1/g.27194 comp20752_c0_seq1/m.27194 type:complete len:923 (-) comp20752_c0_seq1:574-3342(-)
MEFAQAAQPAERDKENAAQIPATAKAQPSLRPPPAATPVSHSKTRQVLTPMATNTPVRERPDSFSTTTKTSHVPNQPSFLATASKHKPTTSTQPIECAGCRAHKEAKQQLEHDLGVLMDARAQTTTDLSCLTEQLEQLKMEMQNQNQLGGWEEEKAALEGEVGRLQMLLEQMGESETELRRQLEAANETLREVEEERDTLREEKGEMEGRLQELDTALGQLQVEARAMHVQAQAQGGTDSNRQALQHMVKLLQSAKATLEADLARLAGELKQTRQLSSEQQQQIQTLQERVHAAEAQAQGDRCAVEEKGAQLDHAQGQVAHLQQQLSLCEQARAEAEARAQARGEEAERATEQLRELQEQHSQLNEMFVLNCSQREKELQEIEHRYQHEAYRERYLELLPKHNALAKRVDTFEHMAAKQGELHSLVVSCQQKALQLTERHTNTQSELASKTSEVHALQQTCTELRQSLDDALARATEAEQGLSARDVLVAELQQQVQTLRESLEQAHTREEEQRATQEATVWQLENSRNELSQSQEALTQAREEVTRHKAKVQAHESLLRKQWAMIQEFKAKIDGLTQRVAQVVTERDEQQQQHRDEQEYLVAERTALEKQLEETSAQLLEANQNASQLAATVEALQAQHTDLARMVGAYHGAASKCLDAVRELKTENPDTAQILEHTCKEITACTSDLPDGLQQTATEFTQLLCDLIGAACEGHDAISNRLDGCWAELSAVMQSLEETKRALERVTQRHQEEVAERRAADRRAEKADNLMRENTGLRMRIDAYQDTERQLQERLAKIQTAMHEARLEGTDRVLAKQQQLEEVQAALKTANTKVVALEVELRKRDEKVAKLKRAERELKTTADTNMELLRTNWATAEKEVRFLDRLLCNVQEVLTAHRQQISHLPNMVKLLDTLGTPQKAAK